MSIGDPFELVGAGDIGVVCIHGFTGTPYEVRFLGEALHSQHGFDVVAPRLPGHGTSVEDLDRTRWDDWVDAVARAYAALAARVPHVAVVGQSLGGLLALDLASRTPHLSAVCALATPLWLDGFGGKVARWTQGPLRFVKQLPKLGGPDVRDETAKAENPCYPTIPTKALGQFLAFMDRTRHVLPRVTQPVLVLHAEQDHTAPVGCARRIAELTGAKKLRILPESYHLIAVDVERDIVAADVGRFIRETTCAT